MALNNNFQFIGNVGKDPEMFTLNDGGLMAKFNLAVNTRYKDKTTGEKKEITNWFSLIVYSKLASTIEEYVKKGTSLAVGGHIQTRTYESKKYKDENGQLAKLQTTEFIVTSIQFVGGKKQDLPEPPKNEADSDIPLAPVDFDDDIPM